MPDQPLVSVLMTAYNREKYIAQAIESVLASTYQNFELIVVDDCSADQTREVAKHHAEQDSRIRLYWNEKNLGDYPNRNRAAQLARGKYLKYVDSDDYIYPHGLAVMVNMIEQFQEAGLGLGRPALPSQPFPTRLTPNEAYREHFLGPGLLTSAPLSAIILRQAFQSVGGFSGKPYVGDVELWLRIAACYPVVKMPRDLVWWRPHAQQETHYRAEGRAAFYDAWLSFTVATQALASPRCPLSQPDREKVRRSVKANYRRTLLYCLVKTRQVRVAFRYLCALYLSASADVIL